MSLHLQLVGLIPNTNDNKLFGVFRKQTEIVCIFLLIGIPIFQESLPPNRGIIFFGAVDMR